MLLGRISKFVAPVVIVGALWYVYDAPYDNWSGFKYFILSFALAGYGAVILRGRTRDISVVAATILLGLAGIEAYSLITEARPIDIRSRGYSAPRPILGWGPEYPGVFHQTKLEAKTRHTIYDVDYTIDEHLNRKVVSAETGPTVAFFGESMTFGTGVRDAETLPQVFADLYDRKIRALNFGFPGYGPQQFLRALETDMFDTLLRPGARLFVFETAAYHVERSSCLASWMLRAPRYEMVDGRATYRGSCYGRWTTMLKQLFANTSLYRVFFNPALAGVTRDDVDLYISILARAGELAREKYGAPTLVLYLRTTDAYLGHCGCNEVEVMQRMRDAGLIVIDATLDAAFTIPGDGHPTPAANAVRAAMMKAYIEQTRPDLNLLAEVPK
jgi:hypothetical protein